MAQRDARLIGVYRIGTVITAGRMLTTCIAHNRFTNDMVGLAIIEFPPSLSIQEVQQALQPVEQRRNVHTPYVIQVHDWGIDGHRVYIATDELHGITLRYLMDNEDIDLRRALHLIRQVIYGLQALHAQGITNIDLRPQLITVDTTDQTDHVQLDDIGLRAILRRLGYQSTQRPDDVGYIDPRYAAPEHLQGSQTGTWSDIYQVGLLLFELVTGRLPFVGRDHDETSHLQCNSPVPPLSQFAHEAPPLALQHVVEKALAKHPEERYADAQELLIALEAACSSPAQPPEQGTRLTSEMPMLDDATIRADVRKPLHPRQVNSTLPELPNAQGIYANLCYKRKEGEIQHLPILKEEVIIGRTDPKHAYRPDIDLTLFDPKSTVSRQHARISFKDHQFSIEDLNSRNKTRLNSTILAPKHPALLHHGDRVRLGSVQLEFSVPGMEKPSVSDHR
jgi:serine/threonine protein kinase